MEESAKHRRVKPIKEVRRHRELLNILGRVDRNPNLVREDAVIHKREIAETCACWRRNCTSLMCNSSVRNYPKRRLKPLMRSLPGVTVRIILDMAIRGFRQAYNPTIRAERMRMNSVAKRIWMPLWSRPFTMVTTVALGAAALACLAILVSQ
jgi:hypothetical protein